MYPLMEEWVIVSARGGGGYCVRWLCAWRSGLFCPLAMRVEEWVIVPVIDEWVIVLAGYARGGVGYCARWLCAWRSELLCLLVEEWVIVPAVYARGGVGYCARS